MNLSHLEYFIAACDSGSISEAAKKSFVSQQTVSAAIASLERELRTSLLERSRTGVTPTPDGKLVYNTAQSMRLQVQKLKADLAKGSREASGPLSLAFQPEVFLSCGLDFEHKVLDEFSSFCPHVEFKYLRGQSDFCLAAVQQGAVDMALVSGITDSSFRVIPIWESPIYLYVRRDHDLANRATVSFDDLRNRQIIAPPNGGYPLWEVVKQCRRYGFTPDVVEATAEEGPHQFYRPGKDLACFVLAAWTAATNDDDYVAIPFIESDQVRIPANMVARPKEKLSPQAEELIRFLRAAFSNAEAQATRNATRK